MSTTERFARTAPDFQRKIAEIAAASNLATMDVYGMWRDYCETCRNYDQSPVMFEFLEWNKATLKEPATENAPA